MATAIGYNERLFSGSGLRSYYHFARYHWLKAMLEKHGAQTLRIVELGCFDGRAVDYAPRPPARYLGLDADWEGGLSSARAKFAGRSEISLIATRTPDVLEQFGDGSFNVAVSLETLEHIPDPVMLDYLAQLARVTDGILLVSVPNEMGPVFLLKHMIKRAVFRSGDKYTVRELVAATLRQPHKVARREHKGFSYVSLVRAMRRHFDIVSVQGIASLGLPPSLSLTVGIVARTKPRGAAPAE